MNETANKIRKMTLESFVFWISIVPPLFGMLTKAFLIYTPSFFFWVSLASVDFNGSLFVAEFQKIIKDDIAPMFLIIVTTIFSINVFVYFMLNNNRRNSKNPI